MAAWALPRVRAVLCDSVAVRSELPGAFRYDMETAKRVERTGCRTGLRTVAVVTFHTQYLEITMGAVDQQASDAPVKIEPQVVKLGVLLSVQFRPAISESLAAISASRPFAAC
jgi:hypothetical protein